MTSLGLQAALQGAIPDLTSIGAGPFIRATLILSLGLPLSWVVSRWARSSVTRIYNPQKGLVVGKMVFYPAVTIIVISVLREFGFSLAPLLGAAGLFGIAIGFASQTSVSNIISGFFLLAEEPFKVGDIIAVSGVTGQVLTIDMLSVKLRTFDNKMVRIPNETLVKSEVTTVTRFPIRRMEILVGIAYKEDSARVGDILMHVADDNPHVLMEPEPVVIFEGYGASSVDFKFVAWATTESFLSVRNSLYHDIKARFDAEGIEIPFPHLSLYTGSDTSPLPVHIVDATNTSTEQA